MTQDLIAFLHDTSFSDLPDKVVADARRMLLDTAGVAVSGHQTPLSRIIRDHAAVMFGGGQVPMIMDSRRVSPVGAALAGGMTIDSVDAHDGHKLTKGHVGCGLLPGLLAVCLAEGAEDDRAFLTAWVLGYELATRAGIALHRTVPDYHTSGAWVAPAVAAVGARVLGLDAARTAHAMGTAEYHGPRSQMMRCIDHPTMVKDGSGWGAMSGVSAAYLAQAGFTGAPAITMTGEDVADLWADLGQRWYMSEQYIKAYPVCRWAQPPAQAVINLRTEHGLTSKDVDHIEIATFHESRRLATSDPQTTEEAQYSTAYPSAVAMVRGDITPADVMPEAFGDPEIRRLADTIVVTEKQAYNDAFPAYRISDVTLHLRDGRKLQSPPTHPLGDPENPLPMAEVRAKFTRYTTPTLGAGRSAALATAIDHVGDGVGLAPLTDALCATPPNGDPS